MRLIDADKMKEYMKVFTNKELMENEEVFEIIDEQPTVPTFGQWIPASNPPQNCEDVIVCVSGRRGNIFYDYGVETYGCCYEDGTWYVCGVKADNLTIHAWMPIYEPEPYNAESEGEK